MRVSRKITIINLRKPTEDNINHELQWLGSSLGLFGLRDKDRSCFRIFIELIKNTKQNHPISSDELASRLELSRGTVVHHLHKLLDSGIVVFEQRGYILRNSSLQDLMDEMEADILRTFSEMKRMASDIDRDLGL